MPSILPWQGAAAVVPYLHLYSINGRLLEEKSLNVPLNSIVVEDKWIITGSEKGFLSFIDLFRYACMCVCVCWSYGLHIYKLLCDGVLSLLPSLNRQVQLSLAAPICSVFMVRDHQSKVCTHLLVGLKDRKIAILYPKDSIQAPPWGRCGHVFYLLYCVACCVYVRKYESKVR